MITEILKNIIIGPEGYYNMFTLEIEVLGKLNPKSNLTIFHEYTHYLQNMTTINGFISLDKYIHVLLTSFSKLGSDFVNPIPPLINYLESPSVLGDKNIGNIITSRLFGMNFDHSANEYIFEDTDLDDYTISEREHFDHYSKSLFQIPYIAIDGKNIPINETVIKENMALVNSIIGNPEYEKLSNNDIDEILSYKYKEYNIIFDFINHYLPECDPLKLVYCLCEISLNIYFSEKVIGNILRLIQNEYIDLSTMKTDEIIHLIRTAINYDNTFLKLFSIIHEKAIKETNSLFDSFDLSNNQFISIMKYFYYFLTRGINYRASQKTLFVNKLTNDYIQELATVIGSPVIFFRDENEYRGFGKTPDYFFNDFIYLHGALKVFTFLYYSNISTCPFNKGNICIVPKNKNCNDNCLNNYIDENYKNCLLSNALNCSGIRQENR